jgi:signal transduction histidine kinase
MHGEEDKIVINLLIVGSIILLILVLFLYNIYIYHKKNQKLYLENIKSEMNGRENERKRIAQDFHDDLGATLSAIKMYLQGINVTSEKENLLLEKATKNVTESITTIRYIMNDLYPVSLDKYGFESSLKELIDQINSAEQIRIIFICQIDNLESYLLKEDKIHIFRIIKEIISNTIKHANSKVLSIRFTKNNRNIILETIDQGIGFNSSSASLNIAGNGLKNITHRVELMGGSIHIESEINKGVQYTIEIPIKDEI